MLVATTLHVCLAGYTPLFAPGGASVGGGRSGTLQMTEVIMKFGGSSVRDAERITEVCSLVKDRMEAGFKPHLVCSAMGKTTNNLLAASTTALETGEVDLGAVRALHEATISELGLEESPYIAEIRTLLSECERTLQGVAMLGELSSRSRDLIVSCAARHGLEPAWRADCAPLTPARPAARRRRAALRQDGGGAAGSDRPLVAPVRVVGPGRADDVRLRRGERAGRGVACDP